MKKPLNEHINRAKELLAADPNNKFIKSYISKLKSLKDVPDNHLNGIEKAIKLVYRSLKEGKEEGIIEAITRLFSAIVTGVQLAAIHDRGLSGNITSADEKMLEKGMKQAMK